MMIMISMIINTAPPIMPPMTAADDSPSSLVCKYKKKNSESSKFMYAYITIVLPIHV